MIKKAGFCFAFAATFALFLVLAQSTAQAQLIISEFRLRGPSGANDEFIEIYNNSGADHTVSAAVTDGSGDGYAVVASDATTRCVIPNGTVVPNKGHYLCVNSVAYSLASYPAGNGTTAQRLPVMQLTQPISSTMRVSRSSTIALAERTSRSLTAWTQLGQALRQTLCTKKEPAIQR
jgi:hypothetical protein